jgi:Carbohydrate esterase, sialic acid-specific acetylesterase/Secretion system C-terminal sorting domain
MICILTQTTTITMKSRKLPFLILLFTLVSLSVFSQINITFPWTRTVFQRNNANQATIQITGQYTNKIDRIEARLVPMVGGQGVETNWQTIQSNPQGSYFSGSITGFGGWYDLEIRGMLGNNVIESTDLQRVGVGEVFLVAGQSNAQGISGYGSPNSTDDRVNTVNFSNSLNPAGEYSRPLFEKLTAEGSVGPRGPAAWCWGRLGDILASRLNVPIMFYNAAWEGTSTRNWKESINGTTQSDYGTSGNFANYPAGQPYGNMRSVLQYYAATTGLRAVLWQQGETDNYSNTSQASYVSNLQAVINQSRQDFGENIPWLIANASYDGIRGVNNTIIAAQNEVIANTPTVYSGPNADLIQPRSADNVHFNATGLNSLAFAWDASLSGSFFASSAPIPSAYPSIKGVCGTNQLTVTAQGNNLSQINWNFGSSALIAGLIPGQYSGQVKDNRGRAFFISSLRVPQDIDAIKPVISIDGRIPMCQGNTVGLISSDDNNNLWSNGSGGKRIDVSDQGLYTVSTRNKYNCIASESINVTIFNSPIPATPTIVPSSGITFCIGQSVRLFAGNGSNFIWSTGETTNIIVAKQSGTYQVRSIDAQGCSSSPASIKITVNNLPNVPKITANGATTFCQGGQVTLSSSEVNGNNWSNGGQAKDIIVTQSGKYVVRVLDANACEAVSDTVLVKVNPLPGTPVIINERPTTFCEGDSTILTAPTFASYRWSNAATTKRIVVKRDGTFTVTISDQNGCGSATSQAVSIKVNPLPVAPILSVNRTPNICENESVVFSANAQSGYSWSNGEKTQSITTNLPGSYTVRTQDINGCLSTISNRISLTVNSLPPKPTIIASGPTTLCFGDKVTLRTDYPSGITWNTNETTPTISVSTNSDVRVRYKDPLGCESLYSDPVTVKINPLPATPVISSLSPTTFCDGDFSTLSVPATNSVFNWNNGLASLNRVNVRTPGDYNLSITDLSTGCTSARSASVKITVNPIPAKPSITANGPTVICADQSVTLVSSDAVGYEWSNLFTTKSVAISREGIYSVKVKNEFGCLSIPSEAFYVKVNPLPATPSIIAEGITSFCEGGQVALRVDSPSEVIWNTNEIVRRIIAKQTGNYSARLRDANGCLSPFSAVVRVDARPIPVTPTIQKIGIYTLEAKGATTESIYEWKRDGEILGTAAAIIKAAKSGEYQVQSYIKYSASLTCYSKISNILKYIPETSNDGLGVYPNPSDGRITMETLEDLRDVVIGIYDASGQYLYSTTVKLFDERKKFDFSFLPSASYIIRFQSPGFNLSKKISIVK